MWHWRLLVVVTLFQAVVFSIGSFQVGLSGLFDPLTQQYLAIQQIGGNSTAGATSNFPVNTRFVSFLKRHDQKCQFLKQAANQISNSSALVSSSSCQACSNRFILGKQPVMLNSRSGLLPRTLLTLYGDDHHREYLRWMIQTTYMLDVEFVELDISTLQIVDLCRAETDSRAVVFTAKYTSFHFDMKSKVFTLDGLQYSCSNSGSKASTAGKKKRQIAPAVIDKIMLLVSDPLVRRWYSYLQQHLPTTTRGGIGAMVHFNWSQWDTQLSDTLRSSLDFMNTKNHDLPLEIGNYLLTMPSSAVLSLRADELAVHQSVDLPLFVRLQCFVRSANFSYEQVRFRKVLAPADSILFARYTMCLTSLTPPSFLENSRMAIEIIGKKYTEAAFSNRDMVCSLEEFSRKHPFLGQFTQIRPEDRAICSKNSLDSSTVDSYDKGKHKGSRGVSLKGSVVNTRPNQVATSDLNSTQLAASILEYRQRMCRLRYPERSFKEESGDHLPVALVAGIDREANHLRIFLEQATTIYTGSLRNNYKLVSAFPGELVCNLRLSGVYANPFYFKAHWTPYDIELQLESNIVRKCRQGLITKFTEAIVLLQDPFYIVWKRWREHESKVRKLREDHAHNVTIHERLLSQLQQTIALSSSNTTQSQALHEARQRLASLTPPEPPSTDMLAPPSIDAILSAMDKEMQDDSVATVFGDGAFSLLNATGYAKMPMRSLFLVSYESLLRSAHHFFRDSDSLYTPVDYTIASTGTAATGASSHQHHMLTNYDDDVFLHMLRFAHHPLGSSPERVRCAFSFADPWHSQQLLAGLEDMYRLYQQSDPTMLCSVQRWVRKHIAPHHRRFHFLFPLTNICGEVEDNGKSGQLVQGLDTMAVCQEKYGVRQYRDSAEFIPPVFVGPRDSFDARVVRELIEHTTGIYSGSLESSKAYKAVFPAEDYCGRRMGVIYSFPDLLGLGVRPEKLGGGTIVRIESKGSRTRCRRGVVTHFSTLLALLKDPYVLFLEHLFPKLQPQAVSPGMDLPPDDPRFFMLLQPFTNEWRDFNASLSEQGQMQHSTNSIHEKAQRLLADAFHANSTGDRPHVLGAAADMILRSELYSTLLSQTVFLGSVEAIMDSARRLYQLADINDIAIHVKDHREALFALLETAELQSFASVERLRCGYAFAPESETAALLQRVDVVQRFYQRYPRVLCLVQQWVHSMVSPLDSSTYFLYPSLPRKSMGKGCA